MYDRSTNSILSVTYEEYECFRFMESERALPENSAILQRFTDQGYFEENKIEEITHSATPLLPFYMSNNINQLTIQVTQKCNLRCTYCSYGGNYKGQRTHGDISMSLDMIKKCVDFAMERSRNVNELYIGLYGGEPFLEFQKIKECVAYVKQQYANRNVLFTITTNGTCFNDEILGFITENEIHTPISFDGPKELHDKNRVFADGSGSFDVIMKNLRYIKTKYPEYYEKMELFTTVSPGTDFKCVHDFFNADDILYESSVRRSLVNTYNAKEEMKYDDLFAVTNGFQEVKVLLAELGLYSRDKTSAMYRGDINLLKRAYKGLTKGGVNIVSHPGGPCIPGSMRPYVDVHGRIFPCERVNENAVMQIGHIDTGFDIKKAEEILNVGRLTAKECMECWNLMHCTLCAAACDGGDKLCGQARLKNCMQAMSVTIDTFVKICLLKENGYDFDMRG